MIHAFSVRTVDSVPLLIIKAEDRKFLIGCSEILSRTFMQTDAFIGIDYIICLSTKPEMMTLLYGMEFIFEKYSSFVKYYSDFNTNGCFSLSDLDSEIFESQKLIFSSCIVVKFVRNNKRVMIVDIVDISEIDVISIKNNIDIVIHLTREEVLGQSKYQDFFKDIKDNFYFPFINCTSFGVLDLYNKLNNIESENVLFEFENKENNFKPIASESFINLTLVGFSRIKQKCSALPVINRNEPEPYSLTVIGCSAGRSRESINSSSYLLRLSDGYIMVDCGDSTYYNLCVFFGMDTTNTILCKLECIYNTHGHSDHYTGFYGLIYYMRNLGRECDLHVSCFSVEKFSEILNILNFKAHLVDNSKVVETDEYKITPYPVPHEFNSHCCVVEVNKVKIFFSGDIDFRTGCDLSFLGHIDLCFHESTYIHSTPRHCTIEEAISNSKIMNPKFIFLTHNRTRVRAIDNENVLFVTDYLNIKFNINEQEFKEIKTWLESAFLKQSFNKYIFDFSSTL